MRFWVIVAALFFCLPQAMAAPLQAPLSAYQPQPPQPAQGPVPPSVEEPDAVPESDEEDMAPEEPVKEVAPAKEKTKKEKAAKEKSAKPTENPEEEPDEVILQGLNKVTARASTIKTPIGSVVRFGTIEIVAHRCWKSAPEEQPENAALLEISEIKQGEPPTRIYLGWMFSSSPGLSSLEHPFYDVTVVECKKAESAKLPIVSPLP